MTEKKQTPKKKNRIWRFIVLRIARMDASDTVFLAGLALAGIGLWGAFSFWLALVAVGAYLLLLTILPEIIALITPRGK